MSAALDNVSRENDINRSARADQPGRSRFKRWITLNWQNELKRQQTQAENEGDVVRSTELSQRLHEAIVVDPQELLPGRVQFATSVTVFSLSEEEELTFQIVSSDEANVYLGKLDHQSPLAKALLGKQEGDIVTVRMPTGSVCEYEVTRITLS